MIGLSGLVISTIVNTTCEFGQILRSSERTQVWISSGDPDPSATTIRNSDLSPVAKVQAIEILREARDLSIMLAEDVGIAGDGGLVIEFAGPNDRDVMITVAGGAWTYFSAAIKGRQVKAGILREDGIRPTVKWVAGLQGDLAGPGVIVG